MPCDTLATAYDVPAAPTAAVTLAASRPGPVCPQIFPPPFNLVGPAGPARISVSLAGHGAAAATTAPAATGAAYFPLLCRRVSAAAAALPAPGKTAAKSGVLHYSPLAASHVLRLRRCRPRDFVTPFILPAAGAESAALPWRPPRLLPSPPPAAPSR